MATYNFPGKQRESYELVEKVRAWLVRREDVADVIDLQSDPRFYYRGDLQITRRGGIIQYIEVKSEPRYSRQNTPFMAVERYSSVEKNISGGPWSTSADFYAHIYADGLLVIMSRRKLIGWIDGELGRDSLAFEYKLVKNETYTTGTYLVSRARAKTALGIFYRDYEIA